MKTRSFIFLILVFCISMSVNAQHHGYHFKYLSLEEGLDHDFYSAASFGTPNPLFSAYPVTGMIRHNRVDGLFLGISEERMNWNGGNFLGLDNINVHGLIGYSIAQKDLQYLIGAEKNFGDRRKWLMVGGEYHNTTSTEDYWRSGIYENAVSSFTAGFDFHDYYKIDGLGFYSLMRPVRNLELGVSYNEDIYSSLQLATDYSLFSRYSDFRMNPAIDAAFDQIKQQSWTVGFTINPDKISRNNRIWTTISVKAELADLNKTYNDFHYNKYQAEAKSYLRLDKSTLIKWRMMAGSITGTAPDFKNFALGGIGSLRAMGYKSMKGNEMLLSNLEVELGKSSGRNHEWVDLRSTHITLFLDSGISSYNERLTNSVDPLSGFQSFKFSDFSHNIGVGLSSGMFKVEVAKPISGTEGYTTFWIRLNPTF